MSELINNSIKRKQLLKHMILQLHEGEAPEQVKGRLVGLLEVSQDLTEKSQLEGEQRLLSYAHDASAG